MVQINFAQKQINAKIVYYGPGMSGKTTNLEVIHQRAPSPNRGDLTSISTDGDRTLFFDYMPLDLGTVAGMRTCFQIYTVPGQVYYNSTRKLVLQGVDGVIFVADSSEKMREQNLESLRNLEENLAEYGKNIATLPLVIQYNKRDLPDAMSLEKLEADLNPNGVPSFEAVANTGQGVFPTLKALAAVVLKNLSQEQSMSGRGARPAGPRPQAPRQPQPGVPSQTQFTPQPHAGAQGFPGPATGFTPQPAIPAQHHGAPHAPAGHGGPVAVPLAETGMTPRSFVPGQQQHAPPAPFPGHAQHAQQHAQHGAPVTTATTMQQRPRPAQSVAGAPRPHQGQARRVPQRPQQPEPVARKKNGALYTGAFIVLATAVGAVLAKAILSVL